MIRNRETQNGKLIIEAGVSVALASMDRVNIFQAHADNLHIARRQFENICKIHNVDWYILEPTFGAYLGHTEPAYHLSLQGNLPNILGTIAEWGICHRQESVLAIYPEVGGGGFRLMLSITKPSDFTQNLLDKFLEELHKKQLSAMIRNKVFSSVPQVEYWGKPIDGSLRLAMREAALVNLALKRIVGAQNIQRLYVEDYKVLEIRSDEYEYYIDQSISGRIVRVGDCLENYLAFSTK